MNLLRNSVRPLIVLATVLAAAPLAADDDARDAASRFAARWGFPDPIEGLWNARVWILPCGTQPTGEPFLAMAMFGRGGTFHDENNSNPVSPAPPVTLRSAAFGQWEHVKGRTYEFAFQFYRFDPAGNFLGSTIVRHTAQLAGDGSSYTSEGAPEFFTAGGQPFQPPGPKQCSVSTANRFK
jgi:hypothetical protein